MLKGVRLRLTLLYLLAACLLIGLMGAGAYQLLAYYFRTTTDLALQHRMADEFLALGVPLDAELAAAEQAWYSNRDRLVASRSSEVARPAGEAEREGSGDEHDEGEHRRLPDEERPSPQDVGSAVSDGELSAIFVFALDASGALLPSENAFRPPIGTDLPAVAAARERSSDLRTVTADNGERVRLLTYSVPGGGSTAFLQLGRSLTDQERILDQLLFGLLLLGGASAAVIGVGSWWLAGRSLRPAQLAWERQQAFVASASHELRTPLTLLRASVEVALRGMPPEQADRREVLSDALGECDHMARLVDDLLLLSRLDARSLQLERRPIDVPALLGDVGRQVSRLADERGVRLSVDAREGSVVADATRLRQVLLIGLDNALRHTAAGGEVRLSARPHGRAVQLVVSDNGAGVAPEHLPRVFERFYRADSARGAGGGTGLGLAIARALVEAQGGTIAIDSRLGAGTQLIITLPASPPELAAAPLP